MIELDFGSLSTWVSWSLAIYLAIPVLFYIIQPYLFHAGKSTKRRILIVVLGELGHSPRILYHARSFSEAGFQVELSGYVDSDIPKDILDDLNIEIYGLKKSDSRHGLVVKALKQGLQLCSMFWDLRAVDYILLQNPPTIPVLPLAVVVKTFSRAKLIIDWHNLGYSILQMKFKDQFSHPLVILAYLIEWIFAKFANYHLTVTKAMKTYLQDKFGINGNKIAVLYDRPGSQFKPLKQGDDRSALLKEPFVAKFIPKEFDVTKDKIFVTSTSFTPDEDISVLIGSLKIYENSYQKFDQSLPRILCFITGKGPLKERIVEQVKDFKWDRVHVEFVWLTAEDYPKLLRLCDYGVSLHTSSSGLDLPMKILDMFGSGLPAICMNYPVLDELVQQNVNGLKFADRRELHEALIFAVKDEQVHRDIKEGALRESKSRWNQSWETAFSELKIIYK
ncbi:unnamed protein product [Kluyveromyces dobzhanskii CBS 2104]|uniref:Chitobiosyldiphosphodolichol beta-mannosyltransferase n=1 Tax=Kluyveromyces dobzhanskii CBS 2104 TaxID=1427455 RepID=A0A0A8L097_9SACH|nr:unnamed protein product [Kluyveromyces dobzhanskii CBS 2104]